VIKNHPKPFTIYSQKLLSQNLVSKEEVATIESLVKSMAYIDAAASDVDDDVAADVIEKF
jgi:hypothetical protein